MASNDICLLIDKGSLAINAKVTSGQSSLQEILAFRPSLLRPIQKASNTGDGMLYSNKMKQIIINWNRRLQML